MKEFLQKKLIRYIIKDVYNLISVEDILKVKGGVWEWKGRELTDEEVATLKVQAKTFSQSTLWKILKSELQYQTTKTLLEKGETSTDIRIAQIAGYLTKVIDDKLKTMES